MRVAILLLFLLLPAFATEAVYHINAIIHRNDTTELWNLELLFSTPSAYITEGDYAIYILDEKEMLVYNVSFFVDFMILADSPEPTSISMIDLFIPYNKNAKYITINHGGKEVFRQDLGILCNKDGACGKFETFLSCPEDCSQKNDNICVPAKNGVCDPQCAEGVDPDCQKEFQVRWWYIILIIFSVIVVITLWIRNR